ncbi:MAG: HD domain-containing protein [Deltaproteobacteria bacterium]|nr:HD domain-containing protein [Deltaproteobacteria bacterium]
MDAHPGRKVGANEAAAGTLARLVAAREALVAATDLAWAWHGEETRKGRATSYLSHLLAVEGLVVECGGGPEEAIAALLHDALEDAPTRAERGEREAMIRARFGEPVLRIVLDCTDTLPDETGHDKRPWRERKERFLANLARTGHGSRLVVACDKRHNLGDLVWDLHHEGPPTFARFNAGAAEQLWYFESVTRICAEAIPPRLALELDRLLIDLRMFGARA